MTCHSSGFKTQYCTVLIYGKQIKDLSLRAPHIYRSAKSSDTIKRPHMSSSRSIIILISSQFQNCLISIVVVSSYTVSKPSWIPVDLNMSFWRQPSCNKIFIFIVNKEMMQLLLLTYLQTVYTMNKTCVICTTNNQKHLLEQ